MRTSGPCRNGRGDAMRRRPVFAVARGCVGARSHTRSLNGSILVCGTEATRCTAVPMRHRECAQRRSARDRPRTRHTPWMRRATCHQNATRQPPLGPIAGVPSRHTPGIQSPLMRRRLPGIGTPTAQGRTPACRMPKAQAVARQGKRRMPKRRRCGMPAIGNAHVCYAMPRARLFFAIHATFSQALTFLCVHDTRRFPFLPLRR